MDPVSLRETERPRDEPGYKKVIGKRQSEANMEDNQIVLAHRRSRA